MKKKITIFVLMIILILAVCIFSVACSKLAEDKIPENEYSFVGPSYLLGKASSYDIDKFTTDYAIYTFQTEIPNEERDKCIYYSEILLKKLHPEDIIKINILLDTTYNYDYFIKNKMYTYLQDFNSAKYISNILLSIYGEYCNYGLIYGYANYLAKELKWDYLNEKALPDITNDNLYDMNLLCFNNNFVAEEEVAQTEKLSVYFVKQYISEYGEEKLIELLIDSGDISKIDDVNKAFTDFYNTLNVQYTSTSILYGYGGHTYTYIARGNYAYFFVDRNWQEEYYEENPMIFEGFLQKDYSSAKQFFEINTEQMQKYQEFFDMDSYDNELEIHIENTEQFNSSYSFYHPSDHRIYLQWIHALMHEYIHSITYKYCKDGRWSNEGLATYYSYKYDIYNISLFNSRFNRWNNSNDTDETTRIFKQYAKTLGRPIDMTIDFKEMHNILTYVDSLYIPNEIDNYDGASSFIQFLVNKYGDDFVINYCCLKNGEYAQLEESLDSLILEWKTYIEETYKDYYMYK